ncbi:MAG: acyclic terpene utilization AtuA family protein [Algoriphagus sp.]|uniref:acyclic terpene utilization AtuA family protein n=1 Tax=Algoriphagus sp. TaxID=1872435 RepID=UPI0027305144|nr:acyclic terpene utilization AtuA family protein [Algoriphagus sp.]MDP2041191.1 acyclic terpene utilization AtuA family protein [Algoriphagus sp.]MDP3473452.1 acyclic terpene utilization AtuA family protein [Algoriphagus sp.]
MQEKLRIGCGAGFSGDRIEPAMILTEKGNLDYLVLECLAERTIALAQKRKKQDPKAGYDVLLERRIVGLLPLLLKNKTRLITNMGAANPLAGAEKIIDIAQKLGLKLKVAVVLGDDVFDRISGTELSMEGSEPLQSYGNLVSANAYLGVDAILPALKTDANIILTGRVADPSLFLAPMIHELNWSTSDFELMGKGTVIGHLLECAGQITGGYFADPVSKPIPDMHILGHPFVDIFSDGSAIISKVSGTGGSITVQTAKEQLLYEVIDPGKYVTPDVIADFTSVKFSGQNKDEIRVEGGSGKAMPKTLKVSVGYEAGFIGEGEISYAGAHAIERAKLAAEIIEKRIGDRFEEFRVDYIGLSSMHGQELSKNSVPYEIRLRIAGKTKDRSFAQLVGEEIEALYTNGPAGGGGARKYTHEVIGVVSILMDRNNVNSSIQVLES